MALLLLKSGKQILGLSSAAAVAKSQQKQQQLGISAAAAASKYLLTTTKSSMIISHHLGANSNNNKYFSSISTNRKQNEEEDNDFEIPPKTFKSFFTRLFSRRRRYSPSPPPPPTPFQELLGKFMDLADESKYYPDDRLPRVLDDIRPILKEMLGRMTDESIVKFLYEFARRAPSSPSPQIVLDRKIQDIVDKLPTHIIHFFQDIMVHMFENRYYPIRDVGIRAYIEPEVHLGVDVIADVSHIGKEHLKVFVVDDLLLVTGTDKAASPAPAYAATPKQMVRLPRFPWLHENVTASILEDQGGVTQLKILFPRHDDPQVVNNKPRVFQLNLDTKGTQ